ARTSSCCYCSVGTTTPGRCCSPKRVRAESTALGGGSFTDLPASVTSWKLGAPSCPFRPRHRAPRTDNPSIVALRTSRLSRTAQFSSAALGTRIACLQFALAVGTEAVRCPRAMLGKKPFQAEPCVLVTDPAAPCTKHYERLQIRDPAGGSNRPGRDGNSQQNDDDGLEQCLCHAVGRSGGTEENGG